MESLHVTFHAAARPGTRSGVAWVHVTGMFRQGAYLLCDDTGEAVAAIVAADDLFPFDDFFPNAQLLLRTGGAHEWRSSGPFPLAEALARGEVHGWCRADSDAWRRGHVVRQ